MKAAVVSMHRICILLDNLIIGCKSFNNIMHYTLYIQFIKYGERKQGTDNNPQNF